MKNRSSFVTGHDFTGCGKTHPVSRFVTGHDFSRAANAAKSMRALAPADLDATVSPNVWSFSAASEQFPVPFSLFPVLSSLLPCFAPNLQRPFPQGPGWRQIHEYYTLAQGC